MRALTLNELQYVSGGGINRAEAGFTLASYGAAIAGGAVVGALGGPAGMLMGALSGAARVAVGGGIAALLLGAYKLH